MDISVVIPTCNRKNRLLSLLSYLIQSDYHLKEVIIVDSGEERLESSDIEKFRDLKIIYLDCEKSVCIQRNKGIQAAASSWIFLCDDDIEVPPDYLEKLTNHIVNHPEAGAVSGMVLQKENNDWTATYPETSSFQLW
jgi:glycosyltransferase involved in cell wall biosynthesis